LPVEVGFGVCEDRINNQSQFTVYSE
jgi:hypothetical protein